MQTIWHCDDNTLNLSKSLFNSLHIEPSKINVDTSRTMIYRLSQFLFIDYSNRSALRIQSSFRSDVCNVPQRSRYIAPLWFKFHWPIRERILVNGKEKSSLFAWIGWNELTFHQINVIGIADRYNKSICLYMNIISVPRILQHCFYFYESCHTNIQTGQRFVLFGDYCRHVSHVGCIETLVTKTFFRPMNQISDSCWKLN